MSPAGIENLTWAFQVQFVQVFLFATLSVLAIVVAGRSATPSQQLLASAGAALAAIAATYSMANGLVVWVVVVGLAGILRLRRCITIALTVVGVVTVFSFLWHFEFSTDGSLSDPVGIAKFVAVYLGSAVWGAGETAAALVGGIGIALFAMLCVLAWKDRAGRSVALPFGVGVATFVVLTAAQTAAGRLDLGTSQALSSRYSIGSFAFWLGIMVGFLLPLCGRVRSFPLAAPTCLAGAAVAALVVGYRTLPRELLPAYGRVRTRADSRCASRRHQRRVELGAWRSGRTWGRRGPELDGARTPRPMGAGRHGRRPARRRHDRADVPVMSRGDRVERARQSRTSAARVDRRAALASRARGTWWRSTRTVGERGSGSSARIDRMSERRPPSTRSGRASSRTCVARRRGRSMCCSSARIARRVCVGWSRARRPASRARRPTPRGARRTSRRASRSRATPR